MTMIVNTPFIYDRNCIRIYEEITNNAITIDGIDYFVDSISPGYKNSKGANSYVFALYQAQNYIDEKKTITEEQEARIDKSKQYFGAIRHTKEDGQIIDGKDIYVYGEINFGSEEDCNILNRFHLLDNDNCFVYSGFNFDKGTIVLKENKVKWYQTTNNIKWLQFNHCLIGKPERIIIYNIDKKKLVNVRRSNI